MAVVKLTSPDFLVDAEFVQIVLEEPTKRVLEFSDGNFVIEFGKFNYSSEAALAKSPITRVIEARDPEGDIPIIELSGLKATAANSGDLEKYLALADQVTGSDANDDLLRLASAGNDTINGAAGNDILRGGAGRDRLIGGDDDDTLFLDAGGDTATGGAGADLFVISSTSRGGKIADFKDADGDIIGLNTADIFGESGFDFGDPTNSIALSGKGNKTTISLDVDGGGDSFVRFATVTGDLGVNLETALAEGKIVLV